MPNQPRKENTATTPEALSTTLPGVLPVRVRKEGLILTLPLACIFSVRQKNSGVPPPMFSTSAANSYTGLFRPAFFGCVKAPSPQRRKKTPLKIVA
jgi:hypothetical protein